MCQCIWTCIFWHVYLRLQIVPAPFVAIRCGSFGYVFGVLGVWDALLLEAICVPDFSQKNPRKIVFVKKLADRRCVDLPVFQKNVFSREFGARFGSISKISHLSINITRWFICPFHRESHKYPLLQNCTATRISQIPTSNTHFSIFLSEISWVEVGDLCSFMCSFICSFILRLRLSKTWTDAPILKYAQRALWSFFENLKILSAAQKTSCFQSAPHCESASPRLVSNMTNNDFLVFSRFEILGRNRLRSNAKKLSSGWNFGWRAAAA